MWIDSDDFLENNHVQTKLEYLEAHKELDIVMCRGNIYAENDLTRTIDVLGKEAPVGTLFEDILFSFRSCQCGLYMIRTKALFEALPEKRIYESPVGQNMQILLPVTINNRIGYIPDKLYNYIVRADSHSHSLRGGIQWKRRLDNLEEMKRHILEEMQISDKFREKMLERLDFQMAAMRMNKMDEKIIAYDRGYAEEVFRSFWKYSGADKWLHNRKIYVWGIGAAASGLIAVLETIANLQVSGIIESEKENAGQIYNGKRVIFKEEIYRESMYIFIPLRIHKDIKEFLMEKGFQNRYDYFYPSYDLRDIVGEEKDEVI